MMRLPQQLLFHLSQITPKRITSKHKHSSTGKRNVVVSYQVKTENENLNQIISNGVTNVMTTTTPAITNRTFQQKLKSFCSPALSSSSSPSSSSSSRITLNDDKIQNLVNKILTKTTKKNDRLLTSPTTTSSTNSNSFNRSYIPGDTFNTEKSNALELTQKFRSHVTQLLQDIRYRNISNYSIQTRGFKTDRSYEAELKRNPTMSTRMKDIFGMKKINRFLNRCCINSIKITRALSLFIAATPGAKMDGTLFASSTQSGQNESLTKLIQQADNSDLPIEQRQNIKIAFAEGYLAASNTDGGQKSGKAMKYLKAS